MFNVLSHHPSIVVVEPTLITTRLDASNYRQDFLLNRDKIRNLPFGSRKLSRLLVKPSFRGRGFLDNPTGTTPVIKVRNVTNYGVTGPYDNTLEGIISPHDRAWTHKGDVLLTVTGLGSSGKADLFASDESMLVDGHIAILRCSSECDNGFLKAFLSSSFGQKLSEQDTIGSTGQIELYGEYIDNFDIPYPDPKIQASIGDKVRLAEKCREEAQRLLSEANNTFSDIVRGLDFSPRLANTNVIQPKQMTDRLSAEFHLLKYYDLENHLAGLDLSIRSIGDLIREPIIRLSSPSSSNTSGYPCILTSDIEPFLIEWETTSLRISPEEYLSWKGALEPNDVVYTSVGPPVGEAAVVLPSHLPMAIGGDVSIIRTDRDLHPGYLALYLNSLFGQLQNDRYARGIRQRRVYPDDIASFLIPILPRGIQEAIGMQVIRYEILNKIAREFTERAIKDAECLVNGTLDTDQILSGYINPESWDFVEQELNKQENA